MNKKDKLTNELLKLIEDKDKMTTSDFQSAIEVFIIKNLTN